MNTENNTIELNRKEFLKLMSHPAVKDTFQFYKANGNKVSEDFSLEGAANYITFAGVNFTLSTDCK